MEQIKLSQEELDTLNKLQNQQNEVIANLGQLEYNIQVFELQKEKLTEQIEKIKETELEIGQKLTEKYGNGSIDLTSGLFTKTEQS